jgi:hypothetical protein
MDRADLAVPFTRKAGARIGPTVLMLGINNYLPIDFDLACGRAVQTQKLPGTLGVSDVITSCYMIPVSSTSPGLIWRARLPKWMGASLQLVLLRGHIQRRIPRWRF